MKGVSSLCLTLVLCVLCELVAPGLATTCPAEYSCQDERTVLLCAPQEDGTFEELYTIGCAGNYSWCDPVSVSCVQDEPAAYTTAAPTSTVLPVPDLFTCMASGLFPDLTNCSRYYNCVDDEPYLQECSGTTPYYAFEYEACYDDDSYCVTSGEYAVDCSGTNSNWYKSKQQLGNLGKYYYYCTGMTAITVNRCYGAYTYNLTTETCQPSCPYAGLFPVEGDSARYYLCSPASGDIYETEFTLSLLQCPQGQEFQEDSFMCVNTTTSA